MGSEIPEEIPPELWEMLRQTEPNVHIVLGMPKQRRQEPVMITLPVEIRESLVLFFENFLELIPDNEKRIVEVLDKMKKNLLPEGEIDINPIEDATEEIVNIVRYLVQGKGSADIDNLRTLLTEYVEEQDDHTQMLLAKKMLDDIGLSDELNKIIRNWNETMVNVAELVPCGCDSCSKECGLNHQ